MPGTLPRDPARDVVAESFPRNKRFRFEGVLGRGGMGIVYRAYDEQLGCEVALKTMRSPSIAAVSRLKAEFRARADLHHPHLVQLFDLVVTGEHAFFTMELVEAVDLLDWVIAGDLSQQRLATAMAQVVSALDVLHRAGFLHRDVKPDNILVQRDGSTRLADFGLALSIQREPGAPGHEVERAGTPAYMAPEQRRGGPLTPASDLYGVGAVIDEALATTSAELDAGWAPLVAGLLAAEPARRPSAAEVLAALGAIAGDARAGESALPRRSFKEPFVGRTQALATLRDAFFAASAARGAVLHVHGPSGIGKTRIVRKLLEELAAEVSPFVVLRGRCHPHEQVDFCGFDGVVDDFARHLRASGAPPTAGIGPVGLAALARLFPALRFGDERQPETPHDGGELRRAGFEALRELLRRAAGSCRLVIWLDDLQWIDGDSLDLLAWLLAEPAAYTLVLSYRLDDETRARLQSVRNSVDAGHDLALAPLSRVEVEALLRELIPSAASARDERLSAMAASAEGYPLFAQVLAQQYRGDLLGDDAGDGDVDDRLASLINRSIDQLPPAQRALLDAISVAAGPTPLQLVARVAGMAQPLASLRALEQNGLVVRLPGKASVRLAPFHDRVRQARLRQLEAETLARLHRGFIAAHQSAEHVELEALVHHCQGAGELGQAGGYAVEAADRALRSLAFASAASYYERALEWLPQRAEPWELHRKLGECYANQGLSQESAQQFQRSASLAAEGQAQPVFTTRLVMRASEQHFHGARVLEGYRLLRQVLGELDTRLPGSHRGALMSSLSQRVALILRGTDFRVRTEAELDERVRLRLDALWVGCTGLVHINHGLADVLMMRHLREALHAGEPSRILRSLTLAAGAEAAIGGGFFDKRSDALFAVGERVLAQVATDYNQAWYWVARGAQSFFRARWAGTLDGAARAEHFFERCGVGVDFERSVNYSYWLFALALTADVAALETRQRVAISDARGRRDPFGENHCRSGYAALLWLYRDDLDTARFESAQALEANRFASEAAGAGRWPEDTFRTPDLHNLIAEVHLALYTGQGREAFERVERVWGHIERALLLRVQFIGADLRYLRARAALAAAADGGPAWSAVEKIAAREARKLRSDGNACARPYAQVIDARLDVARGKPERALARLREAAGALDGLGMPAHAEAVRLRTGELLGGGDGDGLCEAARRGLAGRGIARPERLAGVLAPSLV